MFKNMTSLTPLADLTDWSILIYLALSVLLLTLFKIVNDVSSSYSLNNELSERDNKAVGLSFAGFVFSICIIIQSVLFSPSLQNTENATLINWKNDILSTIIWAFIGCCLLLLSRIINDRLLLPRFSNTKELIENKNLGVGISQAASYISVALIISAILSSPQSESLSKDILLVGLWFIISNLIILIFAKAYQFILPFNIHDELKNNNPAAATSFSGFLLSAAIMISFYISRYDSILALIVWALMSFCLLALARLMIEKIILRGLQLNKEISTDHNWGMALIEAVTLIGFSMIITGAFH